MKSKRVLIIPARKGSKRIKNKNSKFFFGKPIIQYSIDNALKSKLFDKIIITTNDPKIINIKKKYRNKVLLIKRDQKFCKSSSKLIDVLNDVILKMNKIDEFNEIYLLMPCAPLLVAKDLVEGSKILKKNDSFTSVIENRPSIFLSYKIFNNKLKPLFMNKVNRDTSKLMKTFTDVGLYSGWKLKYFQQKYKNRNSFKFSPLILPATKGIDIDIKSDWNFAEILFKTQKR